MHHTDMEHDLKNVRYMNTITNFGYLSFEEMGSKIFDLYAKIKKIKPKGIVLLFMQFSKSG